MENVYVTGSNQVWDIGIVGFDAISVRENTARQRLGTGMMCADSVLLLENRTGKSFALREMSQQIHNMLRLSKDGVRVMGRIRNFLKYRLDALKGFFRVEKQVVMARKRRDTCIFYNEKYLVEAGRVNVHYWRREDGGRNLGDDLSPVVVEWCRKRYGLPEKRKDWHTAQLYAIGSILGFGCQNATIWGSGLLMPSYEAKRMLCYADVDVRAVRGPLTREYLIKYGKQCPAVYGDPAVLLPLIYMPQNGRKSYPVSVIWHFMQRRKVPEGVHLIDIQTDDYEMVIDEISASERIVSSSLHGIILAEAYGVPAVYFQENGTVPFKFRDYYYSTGRTEIPVAKTLEEAFTITPAALPDLKEMQALLLDTFPQDLWNR